MTGRASALRGQRASFSLAQALAALGVSWIVASLAAAMVYALGVLVDVYNVAEPKESFLLASGWLTLYGFTTCGVGMAALVVAVVWMAVHHTGRARLERAMGVGVPIGLAVAAGIGLIAATNVHWLALVLAALSVPAALSLGGRTAP